MRKILLAAVMVLAVGVGQAHAAQLTGAVNYTGDFSLLGCPPAPAACDFVSASDLAITLASVSNTTSGDFKNVFGMNFPDVLDHQSPISLNAPVAYMPLWSFPAGGPYTVQFFLTSYAVTQRTNGDVDLDGVGYFVATGFDQTPGVWSLSAQLETGQVTATYSASSIVPEPASMLLLGAGLLGLAGAARRRR